MKLALFADLHSNLEALSACLAHAQAQGAAQWAFLGDLVGYGPDPAAVLDIVMAFCATGAAAVLGNHDQAAAGSGRFNLNDNARLAIEWTRPRLAARHRAFLAGLPLSVRQQDRLLVHASAADPARWPYVTDARQAARSMAAAGVNYVFGGHVHEPVLYFRGADARPQAFKPTPGVPIPVPAHRRWLAVVGSCGQARDGEPRANYVVFDTARAELTFHRLPYDHLKTARKIRAAGLPETLARRIEQGN